MTGRLRTIQPFTELGNYLQIISATSALAAALVFAILSKRGFTPGKMLMLGLNLICLGAMVGAAFVRNVTISYTLYFVYMFFWEVLFFKHQADVVTATPSANMSLVATFQYASVYLGMIVTGLAGSWIAHGYGLFVAAVAFVALYALGMVWNATRAIGAEEASAYGQ